MSYLIRFPDYFIFGTATSSHQIEGDNKYNDWWDWETRGKFKVRSGKACNHWQLYKNDIELMAKLGYNAYRFSIEWSRIFPRKDYIDHSAIDRYKEIVDLLQKHSIEPMITLHHFTNPLWFMKEGGWTKEENIKYFIRYVDLIVNEIKNVKYWITFNEPIIYVLQGYILGAWPPGIKNLKIADQVIINLIKAHNEAYNILHEHGYVGIAKNLRAFKPGSNKKSDINAYRKIDIAFNWGFLDGLLNGKLRTLRNTYRVESGELDFLGINYYSSYVIKHSRSLCKLHIDTKPLDTGLWTTMGYCIYPKGLYEVMKNAYEKYHKEIFITENGVAVKDDALRILSIVRHLQYVYRALQENIDIRGYFYWSFMDNFEWDKGFEQRFGLIEIDYNTFERKPRKSAYVYSEIARTKSISDELLQKYGLDKID